VELNDLAVSRKNVTVHPLDVTKTDEINALAVELMKEPIDVLINNAGVYLEKYYEVGLGKMKYDDWQYTFKVNTLGPVRIIEAFRQLPIRSCVKNTRNIMKKSFYPSK
jgi:NAD(P)-dependent dehydrogenase (short-subunit alcohol dehydrogenase family)